MSVSPPAAAAAPTKPMWWDSGSMFDSEQTESMWASHQKSEDYQRAQKWASEGLIDGALFATFRDGLWAAVYALHTSGRLSPPAAAATPTGPRMKLPRLPFAVFDEFGKGADDRINDYGYHCMEQGAWAASRALGATPAAATPIAPEAGHGSVDPVEQISPPAAALGRLLEYCDDSDSAGYGVLSVSLVRMFVNEALAAGQGFEPQS